MSNLNPNKPPGAVILAAGNSCRMGSPKAFLQFSDGRCFIEKIIQEFGDFQCGNMVVVMNDTSQAEEWKSHIIKIRKSARIIINRRMELERFYSVQLGLKEVSGCDYCFLHNIDNPFIDTTLLKKVFDHRKKDGYVVPMFHEKGGHPILFGSEVIEKILRHPPENITLKEVLAGYKRYDVPVENENILINIDDPMEYEKRIGQRTK